MSNFFNVFSTREIALFIWFLLFLFFVSRTKEVRHSIGGVIKAFFQKKLILTFGSLLVYMSFIIYVLNFLGLWDISLLKDTCIWILFSGMVLFLNISKVEKASYFSKLVKDNIKVIAIWEFIFNFYTFSLIGELIIIPIVSMFTILQVFAEHSSLKKAEHKKVAILSKNILGVIGLATICYVTYKTIVEYELLFTYANLKSFLLPIVLFVLTLPYFYVLTLYVNYDSFITIVKHFHRNESPSVSKDLIKATLRYANFSLNSLKRVWKYHVHFDASKDNPFDYIKKVSRKPKYTIGDTAKLTIFNNIRKVINKLSNNGIGKLDEWHKSYDEENCYYSMMNYYTFGNDEILIIPNSLAYYLTGEETYIKQLDLVLDIGYQQNRQQALERFIELIKLTFDSLSILMPENLTKSIITSKRYCQKYNTHNVLINYEKFERIEKYTFSIVTE